MRNRAAHLRGLRSPKELCTAAAQSIKPLTMIPKVFFRWVAWLLLFAIAVFTLSPIEFRPVTEAPVSMERFAAFAAIGAAFCLGYPKHRLPIFVLLLGIVGFLEVAQNYVPGRHGRLPDGLVKAAGAFLGVAFATLVTHQKRVSY
jgi:VanZ family protein